MAFACLLNVPAVNAGASAAKPKPGTLTAFIDTLIPADETPAASELGLEARLVKHAGKIENYKPLLDMGCKWLDVQARALRNVDFTQLAQDDRDHIVAMAEASPAGSIPRQLFDHVKQDLFGFYYSHPSIWPSLGFNGPPQPSGYLDYTAPPQRRRT